MAGPSILHSLVLIAAGYWVGLGIKKSTIASNPRAAFNRHQGPLILIFLGGIIASLFIPNYQVDLQNISNMELRNLNHPAYIFLYGTISILTLHVFLISTISNKIPSSLFVIGRRSLFGFGIGNIIIFLWPKSGLYFLTPAANGILLLMVVLLSVCLYDYCMKSGEYSRGIPHWVFRITRYSQNQIQRIVGIRS